MIRNIDYSGYLYLAVILFALLTFALTKRHAPDTQPIRFPDEQVRVDLLSGPASASARPADHLHIVIPEKDSVTVTQSRHRIAANTHPANRAFINDSEVVVYPSGAFAGIIELEAGQSVSEIRVITPDGDTLRQTLHFLYEESEPVRLREVWQPFDDDKIAEVQGNHPFFTLGTESDRLGPLPLSHLEAGILVKLTGRKGSFYRVHLSDNRETWLPKRFARILPGQRELPRGNSGSLSITESSQNDIISFTLGARLPYISTMMTDPNIIEVEVFGSKAETNRVFRHADAHGIRDIELTQKGKDHLLLRIILDYEIHWGYHINYGIGNTLRIHVRRPPGPIVPDHALAGRIIAIDPGHGGANSGALGTSGVLEKEITLDIAKRVQKKLQKEGARVMMTRNRDETVYPSERIRTVVNSDAEVLVSLHANSIGNGIDPLAISGTSTYYRHNAFRPLAHIMHHSMRELPLNDFGLIGNFNFVLNARTELPNVLVETAFLSHPEDEIKLLDPEFREEIAEKVKNALHRFYLQFGRSATNSPA